MIVAVIVFFLTLWSGHGSHTNTLSLAEITFVPNDFVIRTPVQPHAGVPVRLKVPSINVDAPLEPVGLTAEGAVDVPKIPSDAAWFDRGPRPGESGSAVIVGHYGPWKNGAGSVFDDLNKLREGDTISVEDEKGATMTFVVRQILLYDAKADASDIFSSSDGGAHLNLITCEGVWDPVSKSYPKRLVVFADKE
jgi:sortase A